MPKKHVRLKAESKLGYQAKLRYEALLIQALRDIESEPFRPGSTERPEIVIKGARTYHIVLSRTHVSGPRVKEPRHFILYRHRDVANVIDNGPILHDGRDLASHLPEEYRLG